MNLYEIEIFLDRCFMSFVRKDKKQTMAQRVIVLENAISRLYNFVLGILVITALSGVDAEKVKKLMEKYKHG